jgi:hypothetical protein
MLGDMQTKNGLKIGESGFNQNMCFRAVNNGIKEKEEIF